MRRSRSGRVERPALPDRSGVNHLWRGLHLAGVHVSWRWTARPPPRFTAESATSGAVCGNFERTADLPHARSTQRADSIDEQCDRNGFNGVEVHHASAIDRVIARFQDNFARQASDGCRAGRNQRAPHPWNRGIARQHDDRSSTDLGRFAPPQLASLRQVRHFAAAASRNDARSPHSSGSSIG